MKRDEDKTKEHLINELRQLEQRNQSIFELSPDGIMIMDAKGMVTSCNKAYFKLTGYSEEEIVGKHFSKLPALRARDIPKYIKLFASILRGRDIEPIEFTWIHKDGTSRIGEFRVTLIKAGRRIIGVQAVARDITERKQAEETLRESEEKYRSLVERANDGICIIQDKLVKYANLRQAEMWGGAVDEIIDTPFINYIHPDELSKVIDNYNRRMAGELVPSVYETALRRKDGSKAYVELNIGIINYLGKSAEFVITRDITERKEAGEALKERETLFRLLTEQSKDVIFRTKIPDAIYEYVSPSAINLFGYTPEEFYQDPQLLLRMLPADWQQYFHDKWKEIRQGAMPLFYEFPIIHRNTEELRWMYQNNVWIKDSDGKLIALQGNVSDITERKRAEESLEQAKTSAELDRNRLEIILKTIPSGVVVIEKPDGRITFINKLAQELYGMDTTGIKMERHSAEIGLYRPDGSIYPPEELPASRALLHGEVFHNEELIIKRPDGTQILVAASTAPLHDTVGNIYAAVGVFNDITERKQAERQREFTQRLLEVANLGKELAPTLQQFVQAIKDYTKCAAAGIRILDSKGNIPYQAYDGFSRRFYESESPLSIKSDKCMCINVIRGDTDPGLPFYTENGSFYMNGTTAFLATVSEEEKDFTRNVCNAQGYESVALVPIRLGADILGLIHVADKKTGMVPLELVNTLEDTMPQIGLALRRLWAEHELAEEKERLEVTLRSTGDGIIAVDTAGVVVLLNRAAEEMTGWTQQEAAGRAIREVFYVIDERNRKPVPDPVDNVLKTGRIIGLVNHAVLISRDGTERLIADSGSPIHDEQGKMFGAVLVFRDITESHRLAVEQEKVARLESLGTLAGGIAHDFNNLLTGIMGNISLARRYMKPESKSFDRLDEAEKAAVRAKDLTQQLLTFARGGTPVKKLASLTELVKESAIFVLRGSKTRLELSLPDDLWTVEIDEGQINQVIHNIVLNADEAMPAGGKLHISASNTVIKRLGALPLSRGNYLKIDIKD